MFFSFLTNAKLGFGVGGAHGFLPPEIANATPGRGVVLDFSKCDNFAAGKVLHAMLSRVKPYSKKVSASDDSYRSVEGVSPLIRDLIRGLLRCDPSVRIEISDALTMAKSIPLDSCFMLNGKKFSDM